MFNVYTLNRLNGIQSSLYIIFLSYIDMSVISTSVYICKGFSYMHLHRYVCMCACMHDVCSMYMCMYVFTYECMYVHILLLISVRENNDTIKFTYLKYVCN